MYFIIPIFSFITLEVVMRKTIITFNEKSVCLTKLFTDVCLVVHLIFPVKNCLNTALKTQIPTRVMQRTSEHRTPKGLYNRNYLLKVARLDFLGGYLPSLSINNVAMSKDREKRLPQLYYIKMKISYDLDFIAIGVAMAT